MVILTIENLKKFLTKYEEDKEFRDAIDNAPDLNAKRRIFNEAGMEFTKEEVETLRKKQKELSEETLDNIVGGVKLSNELSDEYFEFLKNLGL